MEIRIARISSYVKEVLSSERNGYVHSVYRKTINLCFRGQLVALQPQNTPLSPLSVMVEASEGDFRLHNIKEGDQVEVTTQGILVSGNIFYEKDTETVKMNADEQMIVQSDQLFNESIIMIYESLVKLRKEKGELDLFFIGGRAVCTTQISTYAEKIIREFIKWIVDGRCEQAAQKIAELIGLGMGLTPSGDDFICGMMAGMTLYSQCYKYSKLLTQLKKHIITALKETNDISAAFLRCAVEGYFSEAVIKLPQQRKSIVVAEEFSKIGHKSGADTLCGVFFIVETILTLESSAVNFRCD